MRLGRVLGTSVYLCMPLYTFQALEAINLDINKHRSTLGATFGSCAYKVPVKQSQQQTLSSQCKTSRGPNLAGAHLQVFSFNGFEASCARPARTGQLDEEVRRELS